MDSSIIKTDISDHFPIFTILKTYSYNSPEKKTKIMKLNVITENNTFWFLLGNVTPYQTIDRFLPLNVPKVAYNSVLKYCKYC